MTQPFQNGFDPFAKIDNIDPSQRSPWFEPGEYLLKVKRTTVGNSQQGKGPFWAADFEIVASNCPTRAAGSAVGWPMYFSKGDVVLANIKAFLAAVLRCDADAVTSQVCQQVTSGDGTTLTGQYVRASANNVKTRAGKDFTAINWSPVQPGTEQEVAAQIQGLAAMAPQPQQVAQQPVQNQPPAQGSPAATAGNPLANLVNF